MSTWNRHERETSLTKISVIPNTLRVIPTTIVTFLVYENTKFFLPRIFNNEVEVMAHEED